MEIYKVFRRRCIDVTFCVWLMIGLIYLSFITYHILNDEYLSPFALFGPKKIEAGEDLEKYHRYEVTCDVRYILANQVDFFVYEENDQDKPEISYTFVGLDEDLENPFLFAVSAESEYEMAQSMVEKTNLILNGNKQKQYVGRVTVTGYVIKLENTDATRYIKGLNSYYGKDIYSETEDVYCITTWNPAWGFQNLMMIIQILGWFSAVLFTGIPLIILCQTLRNTGLKRYIRKWNVDDALANQDFVMAWEAVDDLWIGEKYTFCVNRKVPFMIPNSEIVWMYKEDVKSKKQDRIVFYTLDKTKYSKNVDKGMVDCILSYYDKNFKRILIGNSEGYSRLFEKDYNVFLDIRYRQG